MGAVIAKLGFKKQSQSFGSYVSGSLLSYESDALGEVGLP